MSSPDGPNATDRAAPILVEEMRIGSLDGPCDAFGRAFSLAVDDAWRTGFPDLTVFEQEAPFKVAE